MQWRKRRFSTLLPLTQRKEKVEVQNAFIPLPYFLFDYAQISKPGRADLDQKFSFAPRRRIYIRQEEANGNRIKGFDVMEKTKVFNLNTN